MDWGTLIHVPQDAFKGDLDFFGVFLEHTHLPEMTSGAA